MAEKGVRGGNLIGRVAAGVWMALLLSGVAWGAPPYDLVPYDDANKPEDPNNPGHFYANDNSCWMATAANMMWADGWGNQGALQYTSYYIYNYIRNNYNVGGQTWQSAGRPDQAIDWLQTHNGPANLLNDPDEVISKDILQIRYRLSDGSLVSTSHQSGLSARATIDQYLTRSTYTELPGDQPSEGPDDPVGIQLVWNYNPVTHDFDNGHYITGWWENSTTNALEVTDSDAGGQQPSRETLVWSADGNSLLYNGTYLTVGWIEHLDDVPEPGTTTLLAAGLAMLLLRAGRRHRIQPPVSDLNGS